MADRSWFGKSKSWVAATARHRSLAGASSRALSTASFAAFRALPAHSSSQRTRTGISASVRSMAVCLASCRRFIAPHSRCACRDSRAQPHNPLSAARTHGTKIKVVRSYNIMYDCTVSNGGSKQKLPPPRSKPSIKMGGRNAMDQKFADCRGCGRACHAGPGGRLVSLSGCRRQ